MNGDARAIIANYKRVQNLFRPNRDEEVKTAAATTRPLRLALPPPAFVKNDYVTKFEADILKVIAPLSDSYGANNDVDHVSTITHETSALCGAPLESLLTNGRGKAVMFARHLACWRARRETNLSYQKIADIFKRGDDYYAAISFKRIETKLEFMRDSDKAVQPKRPKAKTARPVSDDYAPRGGVDITAHSGLVTKASLGAAPAFRKFEDLISEVKKLSDAYVGAPGLEIEQHTDTIVKEIAAVFMLHPRMVIGVRRDAYTSTARHLLFWRLRRESALSYPQIGTLMSGMNHTTIMYGCARIESMLKSGGVS